MSVKLQHWKLEANGIRSKVSFLGGWIAIEGLPFHLWKLEVFKKIEDSCGGFLEVGHDTLSRRDLFLARIHVKRPCDGFLRTSFDVSYNRKTYSIKIRDFSLMDRYRRMN